VKTCNRCGIFFFDVRVDAPAAVEHSYHRLVKHVLGGMHRRIVFFRHGGGILLVDVLSYCTITPGFIQILPSPVDVPGRIDPMAEFSYLFSQVVHWNGDDRMIDREG
jgi:hypothetical protein